MALLNQVAARLGDELEPDELVQHAVAAFEYGGARQIVIGDMMGPGTFLVGAAMRAVEGRDVVRRRLSSCRSRSGASSR